MAIIEMEVHMDCIDCEQQIRRALSRLEGVHAIDIDMRQQKVTVSGHLDRMTVLEAVRRTGKRAELWVYPYSSEYHPFSTHYLQSSTCVSTNYNYQREGNMTVQDCYQSEEGASSSNVLMDDKATTLFSDENPHACSVM